MSGIGTPYEALKLSRNELVADLDHATAMLTDPDDLWNLRCDLAHKITEIEAEPETIVTESRLMGLYQCCDQVEARINGHFTPTRAIVLQNIEQGVEADVALQAIQLATMKVHDRAEDAMLVADLAHRYHSHPGFRSFQTQLAHNFLRTFGYHRSLVPPTGPMNARILTRLLQIRNDVAAHVRNGRICPSESV